MVRDNDQRDTYGERAVQPLQKIHGAVHELSQRFASQFYDALSSAAEAAQILQRLTPGEFAELQSRQVRHLMTLLDPALTFQEHFVEAQKAGRAHALVGVDLCWLIEAYTMYQSDLQRFLEPLLHEPQQRELVMRVVGRRIMLDLQGQVSSYRRIEAQTVEASSSIDRLIQSAANLSDLIRGAMEAICSVDGEISAFFARVDASGELQIEDSYGATGQRYHQAMMSGAAPKISIDATRPEGQGPGGRGWRSGRIVVSDAWTIEGATRPWRGVGAELGFRAGAAVPLTDEEGRSIALLSLYSAWPGCFSTPRMSAFLADVQRALSHAVRRRTDAPVLPLRDRRHYRGLLAQGRVTMLYQPIVDLRDGSLRKVEALARLEDNEGGWITPDRFLPALGADELLQLLQLGLRQCCVDSERLERQGIEVTFAVNFPAEGIGDPRYEQVVLETLADGRLRPQRLQLEILESHEVNLHEEQRAAFLRRLHDAGVRVAEDDLGSGHSSLLRLDQYGFDEVKIDQALVRGALRRPQRALEFILYLTRLAHAFGMPLTVEGLENQGMIEAAAILGADLGQGYGIARPMPVEGVADWFQGFRHQVDAQRPRTALGALAAYLLWDMQRSAGSGTGTRGDAELASKRRIEHFIALRGLQESDLARLLAQDLDEGGATNVKVRTTVIDLFTGLWLLEVESAAS